MFTKLSVLACLAASAFALTWNTPSDVTSGNNATFTWAPSSTDPDSFTLELFNMVFNQQFAIANNVNTSLGTITVLLPQVPVGAGYTLNAVNISDVFQSFGNSSTFSIGAHVNATSAGSVPATPTGTGITATPTAPSGTITSGSGSLSASSTGASSGSPSASHNAALSAKDAFTINSGALIGVVISGLTAAIMTTL